MSVIGGIAGGLIGGLGGLFGGKPKDPMKSQRDFYYKQLYGSSGHNGLLAALMRQKHAYMKAYDNKYQNKVIDRYGKSEMARETANASASGLGNTTARFVAQRGIGSDVADLKQQAILNRLNIRQGFNDKAMDLQLAGAAPAYAGSPGFGLAQQARQDQMYSGLGQAFGNYYYQNGMPGANNSQAFADQQQWAQLMAMYGGGGAQGGGAWGSMPDYGTNPVGWKPNQNQLY